MQSDTDGPALGRRALLRTVGGIALGATVFGAGTARAASAGTDREAFEAWFAGVDNYDGVVDRTGESTVTVTVGAQGNGGAYAFGPAAVRVDPGTTVVWEWTGEGGGHDVTAADGAYKSSYTSDTGATFERAFDAAGVSLYACSPHEAMGMKGAIVVGDALTGGGTEYAEPDYGAWFDPVPGFGGTVDATGQQEVRVRVGVAAGDTYTFEPAAVRVDSGTTVVWEWTGEGGEHAVAAADGSYASDPRSEAGAGFALTFDGSGVSRYACEAHAGMRGAVVVGAGGRSVTNLTTEAAVLGGALTAAAAGVLGYGLLQHVRDTGSQARRGAEKAAQRRERRPRAP